jgi:hypothetical protein
MEINPEKFDPAAAPKADTLKVQEP